MTDQMLPRVPHARARVPSLDGFRAVSILLVIFSHWAPESPSLHFVQAEFLGSLGVSVFFVISGFLITSLLMDELETQRRISFRSFYLRRVVRILPAYYVYMLVVFSLWGAGVLTAYPRDLAISGLFLRDYVLNGSAWFGHTWSLAVEEQFYLLWPLMMAVLSRRMLLAVCALVIAVSPAVRVAIYVFEPGLRDAIPVMFHTRADTLLFGCAVALLRDETWFAQALRAAFNWRLPAIGLAVVFVISPVAWSQFAGGYLLPVGYTVDNACITLMLLWSIEQHDGRIGRILNARPVVFVGLLSYSLYLWNSFFLSLRLPGVLGSLPFVFVLTFAVAWLSYTLVERPMVALRRRLRPRGEATARIVVSEQSPAFPRRTA